MAAKLTPRQTEIVDLLRRGLTNKQIGHQLGIVEGTVKLHLYTVYQQFDVCTRTQLIWVLDQRAAE